MALITCKECGKEISDTAKICPNCGYSQKKSVITQYNKMPIIVFFIVSGIVFFRLILCVAGLITEYNNWNETKARNVIEPVYEEATEAATEKYTERSGYVVSETYDFNKDTIYETDSDEDKDFTNSSFGINLIIRLGVYLFCFLLFFLATVIDLFALKKCKKSTFVLCYLAYAIAVIIDIISTADAYNLNDDYSYLVLIPIVIFILLLIYTIPKLDEYYTPKKVDDFR